MSTDASRIVSPVGGPAPPRATFIIAEMACSHEGDPALARVIIDAAGAAGADAIQFQVWLAKDMLVPHHKDFELVTRIELSRTAWADLAAYTRQRYPAMQIIACVYEHQSVAFCEQIGVDAYKIHSADLSNPNLVQCVAQTQKRIDLSVGASTLDEIQNAIQWIRQASAAGIWLMYGYQLFPTPIDAIHLRYMMRLGRLFGLPVGYQDHSDPESGAAFWLPAVAMGMEVGILEKHLTHDRSKKGVDYQAALNPDEFQRFAAMVREIDRAKGQGQPRPFSPEEQRYRVYAKKSIVAARAMAAGTTVAEDDLRFMRFPELGLPPDQASRLIGRRLVRDRAAYELLREEDVA